MTNTVPQIAAALIQQNPSKAITISLHEDKITVLSAGEVDTASAMVMLGNALAVVFSELPEEVRNTTALTQLINNANVVTIGRIQKNHPELFEVPTVTAVPEEPVAVEVQPVQPTEQVDDGVDAVPKPQPAKRTRVARTKPTEETTSTKDPKPAPVKRKPVQRSAGAIAGRGKTK